MATVMRTLSFILMFTISLGVPMLCKGGILQHPCDESHTGTSSHHEDEHHDDQSNDGGCGHEDGCAADPCSLVIRTSSKSTTTSDDTLIILTIVALSDDSQFQTCPDLGDHIGHSCADVEPSPPGTDCALPLLI